MTEAEWRNGTDPAPMLQYLVGHVSARKLRLFACACCRRVWHLLADERSRFAVQVMEGDADGTASNEDKYLAVVGAEAVANTRTETAVDAAGEAASSAAFAALNATLADAARAADYCAANVISAVYHTATSNQARSAAAERAAERLGQVRLLWEVFGNPFRVLGIDDSWLAWNDGTIPKISQTIYDERAFDRLPILADALEDAGCDNADIIAHCRGEGPHVRGCWVVDLLLGKS